MSDKIIIESSDDEVEIKEMCIIIRTTRVVKSTHSAVIET